MANNGPTSILSDIQTKVMRLGPFIEEKGEGRELYNELEKDLHALRVAIKSQGREIKTSLLNKIKAFLEE